MFCYRWSCIGHPNVLNFKPIEHLYGDDKEPTLNTVYVTLSMIFDWLLINGTQLLIL